MAREKMTKRKIQGKETRQKIFDTSLALFNKYGYDKVTIDDICEKIGMSKGAFYTHFKSKDQIILEDFVLLNSYYDEVFQELSSIQNSLPRLYLFQQQVMKKIETIGYKAVKLVYHVESSPNRKKSFLISRKHNLYKIIHTLVTEGQNNNEIRKDKNPDMITTMIVQLYRGIILDWCLENGEYKLTDACNDILPLIYAGIKFPDK